MDRYPLFYTHGGLVAGQGFIARVELEGRCILEHTDEEFYSVFGLNPGGASGQGVTREEASRDFLDHIEFVIRSYAEEADDFAGFQALINEFFFATNSTSEREWAEAVRVVREKAPLAEEFNRTVRAETQPTIKISAVAGPAANDNFALTPDLNVQRAEMHRAA